MSDFMGTEDLSFLTDDGFIDLDFTGVQARDFQPAPPGNYIGVIVEARADKSSQKQTPYLAVKMEIQGCVDKVAPIGADRATGKFVYHNLYLTPKSMEFNKPFFDALAGGNQDGPMKFKPDQLVGMRLGMTLKVSGYVKTNDDGTTEDRQKNDAIGFFPVPNL